MPLIWSNGQSLSIFMTSNGTCDNKLVGDHEKGIEEFKFCKSKYEKLNKILYVTYEQIMNKNKWTNMKNNSK